MKREIKFRGWAKNENGWLYGYPVFFPDEDFDMEDMEILYYDEEDGWVTDYIYPHTLGQWTGARDVDGKDIYEDDVVEEICEHLHRYVVTFEAGAFVLKNDNGTVRPRTLAHWLNFKVVGPRYDIKMEDQP